MRRISLLAVTAATAVIFSALGATIQSASAAPATYNWTGFYLGLNAGGNWGTAQPSATLTPGSAGGSYFGGTCQGVGVNFCNDLAAAGGRSFNTSGFIGGVQGGYNWQSGNLLTGIEIDFQYFRSAGSNTVSTRFSGGGVPFTISQTLSTDWLFTVRPRVGMVSNNWLYYGTGGLAVTRIKTSGSYVDTFNAPCDCASAETSATKAGWTLGGGIEAALPGGWIVGGEYLFVKFGKVSTIGNNFLVPGVTVFTDLFSNSSDLKSNILRARFSKKF